MRKVRAIFVEKMKSYWTIIITCSRARAFITASHFLPQRRSDFTSLKNLSTMGLMMSSSICNIVAQSNAFTTTRFSPLCSRRSIDPASFSSSCLLLPFPSRFSFSTRDCNGYDFSFLPTITYARKRIYGMKCKHPSPVANKIQNDEQTRFPKERRERKKRGGRGFALTNKVAICFGK